MLLNSEHNYFKMKSVIPYIKDNFGFDINEEEVEEYVDNFLNAVGNLHVVLYKFYGKVTKNNKGENYIDLPCNVLGIESITTGEHVEDNLYFTEIPYTNMTPKGKFIQDWTNEGTYIKFENYIGPVEILYEGQLVDEENYPKLNLTELEAFAEYLNHIRQQRRFYSLPFSNDLKERMLYAKNEMNMKIDQARVDFKFNQNLLNRYFDIKTSFNRKYYNKDIKLK